MSQTTMTLQRVPFSELLVRCDDETLQLLVGQPSVRLLNILNHQLVTPSNLRRICLQINSPHTLLRNPETRCKLLEKLRPEESVVLTDLMDENVCEPYAALRDMKIRKNSSREQKLFSFFGLASLESTQESMTLSMDGATTAHGLFDHQRQAQRKVQSLLSGTQPRVMLHMPTGAGKTRTALHVVATALRQKEPCLVVWLAYSEELCEQAADEFQEAWSHLGDRKVDLYRFWGNRNIDISEVRDGFMVAGLSKSFERARRDGDFIARLADRASLVIIDEAHQAIAETYRFLLDYLVERNPRTGLLGLTATPGRTWNDPSIDEELADFFRRQKVTLCIPGYGNPVDYLVNKGYLAKPLFTSLTSRLSRRLTDEQTQEVTSSLEIPESILKLLAEDEQRNLVIIDAVEDLTRHHKRLLIFAATVAHADMLTVVLRARGHRAEVITATTPHEERHRIITSFKSNEPEPMILCNYGVLTTGFDAPKTSAAVIARPTKSLVLYSQMIGRALRGPLAGGNAQAEILTIVDRDLPGFRDMSEAFQNWEDVWDDR